MVLDPPKENVNVTKMIVYSLIPILSVYVGWRIQKFWLLFGINLSIGVGLSVIIGIASPYPYGTLFSIMISIPVSIILVKHYAERYNQKIHFAKSHTSSTSKPQETSEEPLVMLKMRLVKGEITPEEYVKIKKVLNL